MISNIVLQIENRGEKKKIKEATKKKKMMFGLPNCDTAEISMLGRSEGMPE